MGKVVSEDITDVLTKQGRDNLKVGQILMFDFEGSALHLKITRKAKGRVWAKRVDLYTPEEADAKVTIVNK